MSATHFRLGFYLVNRALTRGIAAIVFAVLGAAASAEAETQEETAYGWGELVGAMTSCRLPPGTVDRIGRSLLRASGIDPDAPSDALARYKAGMTSAPREMTKPGAATCAGVRAQYDALLKEIRR